MEIASFITLLYTATYIGTVYAVPAFLTYKAIQHDGHDAFRVREWSMYWTVLAAFFCVQYFVNFALSWLPFYHILELAFLASLWLPSTRLAVIFYKSSLGPWLSSHEAEIDAKFNKAHAEAEESADRQAAIVKATLQRISGRVSVMLQQAQHRAGLDRLIQEIRARAAAVQERQEVRARAAAPQQVGARAVAGAGRQQQQAPQAAAQPQAPAGLRHRNLNVEIPNANRHADVAVGQAAGMPEPVTSPGQPKTPDATFPVGLDLHSD